MSNFQGDPREELGLHMLLTTMGLQILREAKLLDFSVLQEVLSYYRSHPLGTIMILMHEEPLYIAGSIAGMNSAEIDDLPSEKLEQYHSGYLQITENTRTRRRDYLRKIWPSLNEIVLQENVSTNDYQLHPIPPVESAPPQRPLRKQS